MKRLLPILLALMLLSGCTTNQETPPVTQHTPQTESGWYIPESAAEAATNGAVRSYELKTTQKVTAIGGIGDQLLLHSQDTLTVLSGENGVYIAAITTDVPMEKLQPTGQGVAYYEASANEMIYFNQKLQVISKVALPQTPDGQALTSPDGNEIFYSVGGELRAFDTNLNIARLVKSQLVESLSLERLYFGDRMLHCTVRQEDGRQTTVYLRTDNGMTLSTDSSLERLETYGDHYVALRRDGTVRQLVFGTKDTDPRGLALPKDAALLPAVNLGGVATCQKTETSVNLDFYDSAAGKRTASVTLPQTGEPDSWYADPLGRCLWFVAEDLESGKQRLYRWDMAASAVADDTNYHAVIYTAQNPDTEGLSACQERAKKLEKTHGIDICIFQDAVKQTGAFAVEAEHQTAAINAMLEDLEKALGEYPEKFLKKSVHKTLHICIVRSVDGAKESAHYYKKSHAYIFLPTGCEVESQLLKSMGYIVNSRVVSNTSKLDTWTDLNPKGFAYGEGKQEYLEGDDPAFADLGAMQSVVDDRASIFRCAMEEGNEELFAGKTMQKKLKLLCEGIRRVWKWRKEEVSYPWEQYLKESLAYKK